MENEPGILNKRVGFLRYNYHTSGIHTSSLPAQTQRFLQHFPGILIVFSFGLAQFFGLSGILGQYSMLNRPLLQLTRPVHKGSLSLYPCLIRRLLKKQCFAKL